jgi:HD-like signal output (HDOD) protein
MHTTTHHSEQKILRGAPTLRAVAELTERIGNLFASPSFQPPVLPCIAIELLDVALYPDIDLRRVSRLIARDPLLAGRVMQRVQSPYFAGRVPITGLDQAIFRLGLDNIRDIVLEAALNIKLFTTPGYSTAMERIRRHSVATAHIGRILAEQTGQDPHRIFLLGLLHDIGLAAGLITVDQMFTDCEKPPIHHIWPAIETTHESAGTLLARIWDLPGDLPRLIGQHHHFQATGADAPELATIHVAEAIANRLGRGITPVGPPDQLRQSVDVVTPDVVTIARKSLRLSQPQIVRAIRVSEERLDAIR